MLQEVPRGNVNFARDGLGPKRKVTKMAVKEISEGNDGLPKDGKNYEKIVHEGKAAINQRVVGEFVDADEECKKLGDEELMLRVSVGMKGGKAQTTAVIPLDIADQVPEILTTLVLLLDKSVRERILKRKSFEAGFKAGQEAAKKSAVSENGEEVAK